MPKTVILAIFTLGLAAATLVTDLVSPYRGAADTADTAVTAVTASQPGQAGVPLPTRAPVRQARDRAAMDA